MAESTLLALLLVFGGAHARSHSILSVAGAFYLIERCSIVNPQLRQPHEKNYLATN
jgi:hypothetical protein